MLEIVKQSEHKNLLRGNPAWGRKSEGTGKSGNGGGHPHKYASLTILLKDELERIPKLTDGKGGPNKKTWAQLLSEALPPTAYKALLKGNTKPYEIITERCEGRPVQPMSGEGGGAIKHELVINVQTPEQKKVIEEIASGKGL